MHHYLHKLRRSQILYYCPKVLDIPRNTHAREIMLEEDMAGRLLRHDFVEFVFWAA